MKIYNLTFLSIVLLVFLFICNSYDIKNEHPTLSSIDGETYATLVNNGSITDTMKTSPLRISALELGEAHVSFEYGSPGIRGRKIWGSLVPYGKVWVTGAHQTKFNVDGAITIAGSNIESGNYSFFTIPGEKEWTVIVNKNPDQHLADNYDSKDDLFRFKAIPTWDSNSVDRLTYTLKKLSRNKAEVIIAWGKMRLSFLLIPQ